MSNMEEMRKALHDFVLEMGASAFGVADLDALRDRFPDVLNRVGGGYSRAVVFGMRLQAGVLESLKDSPTPLYFHNYRQLNYQLDGTACVVADRIQKAGHKAIAIAASQIVCKDPMTGHISHKLLGWAAGIGFFGRNNLLVHPQFGAQLRYVSVLTDVPLEPDRPHEGNCGECFACLAVCPARAIGRARADFNLKACYDKLTEFTRIQFVGQHICGVCVKACDGSRGKGKVG